jgi:hypothetical protein
VLLFAFLNCDVVPIESGWYQKFAFSKEYAEPNAVQRRLNIFYLSGILRNPPVTATTSKFFTFMPYRGRKRQKAIAHVVRPVRNDELTSQHPDSEGDTSSSSAEDHEIGDHSSTENEEEEGAASTEAPEHHMPLTSAARIDDQTGLSVSH